MDRQAHDRLIKEMDRVDGLNFMKCGRCHQIYGVQYVGCQCDGSELTAAENRWVTSGAWTIERQDKRRRENFDAAMKRAGY